jgi:hypothetical protein
VRVHDSRNRALRAGSVIRVYAAGSRRLIAARLVDSGSSYDAQSDIAEHVGVGRADRVDVEVTWPSAGTRRITMARNVDATGSGLVVVKSR